MGAHAQGHQPGHWPDSTIPALDEHGDSWPRELLATQSAVVAAGGNLDAVMDAVVDGALRVMPQAAGAVIEMRDGDEMVYRAASGTAAAQIGLRLRVDASLSGRSVLTGEAQLCPDTEHDPRVARDACRRLGIRSMIVVPLPFRGTLVGAIKVYAERPNVFGEKDILLARLLAGPIAVGLATVAHADAARAQADADRRFAATFEQAAVGIAHVSPDGRFLLVNDRFCDIAGYSRQELIAGGFQQITHPEDLDADLQNLAALAVGRIPHYSMEKRYIRKDGTLVWINLTVSLVRRPDGHPDFYVAVIEDISARKVAQSDAAHDGLTGLFNRRGLFDTLSAELGRHRAEGRTLAVGYLDLDRFKPINDRFGHIEGDRCLVKVAAAVRAMLRTEDLVARVGGDEFVVVLPDASEGVADRTLAALHHAVAAAAQGEPWPLTAAAGVIVVPAEVDTDVERIIAAADHLMYEAKQGGGTPPYIRTLR